MVSKAYAHLCSGTAAALRMGLHISSLHNQNGVSEEALFRRRQVFSVSRNSSEASFRLTQRQVLYAMDTYIASVLGMPKLLRDADVEQLLPLRKNDILDQGRSWMQQNLQTPEAETLLHLGILRVMAKINMGRYPTNKVQLNNSEKDVATAQDVAMFEAEMLAWHQALPEAHAVSQDFRALKAHLVMRHTYALTEMVLYRPFLHHLHRSRQDPDFSIFGFTCASRCVGAAMQAVW
jgi:hypothetical protein